MDRHLARLLNYRRLALTVSVVVSLYGFIMSLLIATSIGLNSYTPEELDSIERLQDILRGVVAVGAIAGMVAAVAVAFESPFATALLVVAGTVTAIGLGLVSTGWSVVSGPRVEYFLGPVPVIYWAMAGLFAKTSLTPILTFPLPGPLPGERDHTQSSTREEAGSHVSQGAREESVPQKDSEVSR
jgi:hypothetical protein